MQLQQTIEEIVKPIANEIGYEFVGVECIFSGKAPIVRIYIDREQGVDVNDCAIVSRQTASAMDVEVESLGKYNLEVSSPGADRRLFTIEQCTKQIGKIVKLTLITPIDEQANFKGKLLAVDGEQLLVEVNAEEELKFNFNDIKQVRIVPQWLTEGGL